jgi:hypothetical protein
LTYGDFVKSDSVVTVEIHDVGLCARSICRRSAVDSIIEFYNAETKMFQLGADVIFPAFEFFRGKRSSPSILEAMRDTIDRFRVVESSSVFNQVLPRAVKAVLAQERIPTSPIELIDRP